MSLSEFGDIVYSISDIVESIESIFAFFGSAIALIAGIFEVGILAASLIIMLIGAIVAFVIGLLIYVVKAIPVFYLAKKNGRKLSWLAWIPVFHNYFVLYVLSDIAGEKEFSVFNGKFKQQNRTMVFWCYIAVAVCGNALISVIIGILSMIPGGIILGSATSVLYLVPSAACAIVEFVYLRDVLSIYCSDEHKNAVTSIIITVLDCFVTYGFARTIYLYTLLKKQPILVDNVQQEHCAESLG